MERKLKNVDFVNKTHIKSFSVNNTERLPEQLLEDLTKMANDFADDKQLDIQSFQVIVHSDNHMSMVVHYQDSNE